MEKFAEVDADIGDEDLQIATGRDDYNHNIFLLQRFHAVPTTDPTILRSIVDGRNEKENNKMGDVCYVCLEAGDNVIRSPCACRAPVHQRCFVQALVNTSFKCTICQTNCDHVIDLARKVHRRIRADHCPVAYEREEREREERERNEMLDRHAQEMRELLARQARDQEKRHERRARRLARRATEDPTS